MLPERPPQEPRLVRELRPGGAPCWLAGRIEFDAAGACRLIDESGWIELVSQPMPAPGDYVAVGGSSFTARTFYADQLRLLARAGAAAGAEPPGMPARVRRRSELLAELRATFTTWGFQEVDAPVLMRAPGQEPHLRSFETFHHGAGFPRRLYLSTSPEYVMKRLLVQGCRRIFSLGHSFRDGRDESSALHHPEFTMLEWYRAFGGLEDLRADLHSLLRSAAIRLTGGSVAAHRGCFCDLAERPQWCGVEEAFREFAGVDLGAYLDEEDHAFVAGLPSAFRRRSLPPSEEATQAFFRILVERVEPHLGIGAPMLLCRFPARHAALARRSPDDPRVAERFELYIARVEVANAFDELCDADEQEARLREEQRDRRRRTGRSTPLHLEFLDALRQGMPPSAGIALGVDRLQMLLDDGHGLGDTLVLPVAL